MPCRNVLVTSVTATTVTTSGRCAGIVTPVVATSGNGIPLDAEADEKSMKVLFLDPGLLLAVLQLEGDLSQQLIELILAGTPQELVNKGGVRAPRAA